MEILYGPGLGALSALGSALTWALISLLVRTLSPVFNSVTINAVRTSVGSVLLLVWLLLTGATGELLGVSPKALGFLAISTALAFGLGDTVFFESTRSLGLARAMTVSMTYPLIAALLAWALIGEPITASVAAGSLLTLGGLALIVTARKEQASREERFWLGLATATLASIAWAVSVILMKPPLREVDATIAQAIRLPLAGALLWATPWTRGAAGQLKRSGNAAIWRMTWLGALTAASSVMFVAGLKYAGVAVATVLSSTAPMFAIPLGLFFLGERLAPRAVLGSLVTVAGIALLQL
ncbi:MAG: DMT family transporter [Candidatus Rokubacteria bacterium]|nr:DMT family transporter [Candidatus Rokubacteria bacterium]